MFTGVSHAGVRTRPEAVIEDARALARNLGIKFSRFDHRRVSGFQGPVQRNFQRPARKRDGRNMQPRMRAMILMALSNKFRSPRLSTGNKSELAVGLLHPYGDMAGGWL